MFKQKWNKTKPLKGVLLNGGHPLARGLVGCWLMNEGSGKKIYDLSGNRNTGIFAGDTKWTAGKFGSVLSFDGTDDYVYCGLSSLYKITTQFTLCGWIKVNALGINQVLIVSDDATNRNFGIYIDTNNVVDAYKFTSNTATSILGTTALTTGIWYFICVTYNSINLKVYLNGSLNATPVSATGTVDSDSVNLTIGARASSDRELNGLIDNAQIYNRALSASEIAWLYREPFAMFNKARLWKVAGAAADNAIFFGTNF